MLTPDDASMMNGSGAAVLDAPEVDAPPDSVPEPPREFEPEELDNALANALDTMRQKAIALSWPRKLEGMKYESMRDGMYRRDDPMDLLVQRGYVLPLIAKLIKTWVAAMAGGLVPDGSAMDFFRMKAKESQVGMDLYAKIMERFTREKFKEMKPDAARNYKELIRRQLTDLATFGVCAATWTHEMEEIEDGDGVIEGPTKQYLDWFNAWPHRVRVNQSSETPWTLYAPLVDYSLDDPSVRNADKVREESEPTDLPERDPDGYRPDRLFSKELTPYMVESRVNKAYRRYIYYGEFPMQDFKEALGINRQDDVPDYEVLAMVIQRWALDAQEATKAKWWMIEYIGTWPIRCRPYPYKLPVRCCPIQWVQCIPVNNQLMGLGFYDRGGEMNERLANFFMRAMVHLVMITADPPVAGNRDRFDPTWLQQRGPNPRLRSGEIVWLRGDPTKPAFEQIYTPVNAIQGLEHQMQVHDSAAREETGVTHSVEGNDTSRTATQNANNLQQSLGIFTDYLDYFKDGMMKEDVQTAYTIGQQHAKMGIFTQSSQSFEDNLIQTTTIDPAHLQSLYLVDIEMTAATDPGSNQQMLQFMQQFVTTMLPTINPMGMPTLDANAVAVEWAKRGKIDSPERLLTMKPGAPMDQMSFNLMGLLGQTGMQYTPPWLMPPMPMGMPQGGAPPGAPAQPGGLPSANQPSPAPRQPGTPTPAGGQFPGANPQRTGMSNPRTGAASPSMVR